MHYVSIFVIFLLNHNGDNLVYKIGSFIFKVSPSTGVSENVVCICKIDKLLLNVGSSNETYFVNFTDDFSRYGYIYFTKHKSETFEVFKEF